MKMSLLIMVCGLMMACTHTQALNIVLVGDSTVTDYEGWGKAFAGRFNSDVKVENFSMEGRSSKSFYNEGRLDKALVGKPDYVLIQFGHNDQPGKGADRETDPASSFRDFLRIYVNKAKKAGARPILVSSLTRRKFDNNGLIQTSLTPWAEATMAVAKETQVSFIDLHSRSVKYHNKIGYDASMKFNAYRNDTTHINQRGAEVITDLIIKALEKNEKELAGYLR